MTDLNTLPDDIKQAFNYFIKRVGELELSSFLMQSEVIKLIKMVETLNSKLENDVKTLQGQHDSELESIKLQHNKIVESLKQKYNDDKNIWVAEENQYKVNAKQSLVEISNLNSQIRAKDELIKMIEQKIEKQNVPKKKENKKTNKTK